MKKPSQLILLIILSICWNFKSNSQITLTHNIGNTPIETDMPSCEDDESWARTFILSDFGITTNEQFIINSGQIAISKSYNGARLGFGIFSIDSNFPNSTPIYIGGSQSVDIPEINGSPQIIQIDFVIPVVVPAVIERILVLAQKQEDFYNPNSAEVFIAGTEEDNDTSWYKGCNDLFTFTSTEDLNQPVPNANFYINVTGEKFSFSSIGSSTTLTHNFCGDIIKTMNHSCSYSYLFYGRDFYLNEYGISNNEQLIITKGQVGITYAEGGASVQFKIYKIDDNFPQSFSESDLIGQSQEVDLPYISNFLTSKQIIPVMFETPIIIPENVERILVEVKKGLVVGGSGIAHIAGTEVDDGNPSWYRGCLAGPNYINPDEIWPGTNYRLYINVTGNVNHVTNNFGMNISNICSEFLKEFSIEDSANVTSVVWDFGDPTSGLNNNSTDISPFHDFSDGGTYTITATVTGTDASVEILTETIDVNEPPNAYGINNVYACEDDFGTGISSSFDVSMITQQVLGGQIDKVVIYIDGSGNEYNELPNPFTNSVSGIETIRVKVSHEDNLCCYSETTFDLIVNPLPTLTNIIDLTSCENNSDGFANFDISAVEASILGGQTGFTIEFYDGNEDQIPNPLPNDFINSIPNQEIITVRLINDETGCSNETTFTLNVNELPIINSLDKIIGCDDNNDGISEYFDTTNVENQAIGSQTGMVISYFDNLGNTLPNPLPNPFTNTEPNTQNIIVRVSNSSTNCYSESILRLETATQPLINQLSDLFACDEGDGYAHFDTSSIENILIGSQTGLDIFYFDENGNALPSPLPNSFLNTTPYSQEINVKVENTLNSLCYSETSFNLVTNDLPIINLENEYLICNLDPSISLSVSPDYYSYSWHYGTELISENYNATIIKNGNYQLTVTELLNGIECENTFDFTLSRSVLPEIQEVNYGELGNNFIEIIAIGDGDFLYSINGISYQENNYFDNIQGGTYNVYVKDSEGCGEDMKEVTIIDYPNFFTPNNDGSNDHWQIKGINKFPDSKILIFDRYGKLMAQLYSNDLGWDGLYNGKEMPSNDYWFKTQINNEVIFSGHFALKR